LCRVLNVIFGNKAITFFFDFISNTILKRVVQTFREMRVPV